MIVNELWKGIMMGELTYHILEHIKPQYKKHGINTEIEQSLEQTITRSKILIIYTIGSILCQWGKR